MVVKVSALDLTSLFGSAFDVLSKVDATGDGERRPVATRAPQEKRIKKAATAARYESPCKHMTPFLPPQPDKKIYLGAFSGKVGFRFSAENATRQGI